MPLTLETEGLRQSGGCVLDLMTVLLSALGERLDIGILSLRTTVLNSIPTRAQLDNSLMLVDY